MKQLTKVMIIGFASIFAAYGLATFGIGFFTNNVAGIALLIFVAGVLLWRPIYIFDLPLSEAVRAKPFMTAMNMIWLLQIFIAGVLLCTIS